MAEGYLGKSWKDYLDPLIADLAINPGPKPAILVFHGMFGSADNWASFARQWEALGHRVLVPELPLHGFPGSPEDLRYDLMADQCNSLLKDYGLPCIVLGHSMGGKLAMQIALGANSFVQGLLVVDMAPRVYKPHHQEIFEVLEHFDFEAIRDRSTAQDYLKTSCRDPMLVGFFLKYLVASSTKPGYLTWRFDYHGIKAAYGNIVAWQEPAPGRVFHGPARLITGGHSDYVDSHDVDRSKGYFPNLLHRSIPGAGHWVQAEKRQEFSQEVEDFLGTWNSR